jgi:CrcB protein
MSIWLKVVLVAVGGALGALGRMGVGELVTSRTAMGFAGTVAANMLGCLAMGAARAAVDGFGWGTDEVRTFVFTGCLGAFTTFSTFEADAVALWRDGHPLGAVLYTTGSVLGGLLMFFVGWWLVGRAAS